ncbi:MAG: glycoside hydrolase family 15 protein [Chloroflexi bacterium]|nr:glycoside hydrolase family 15 protein [Chloroflexota bacterium]
MKGLYQRSLEILRNYQSREGAFVASPEFDTYRYAWFRDGAFCAYALALAGETGGAARFFTWSSRVVLRYRAKIEACIQAVGRGELPGAADCFHSRFTLEGEEVPGHWGHHQLDGLGTWLWALADFQARRPGEDLPGEWEAAAALVQDYLAAMWPYPCSDCWEENETGRHTYTLAAIYAGMQGYAGLSRQAGALAMAQRVRQYLLAHCTDQGAFVKSVGSGEIDANLISLGVPYRVVAVDDPRYRRTLARIQAELATPTGLHRYRQDSYYGGGEWVLLTAWQGWADAAAGKLERAQAALAWVEAQADANGNLPEQVPHCLLAPQSYTMWEERWGRPASPLLWSHAQYVILCHALQEAQGEPRP